ncbi:hypothetical protein G9A89_020115 [Geosiphon pyriformis]|nr:hypothetical protein G9A89_020115 [Geosiphon pyriformis]
MLLPSTSSNISFSFILQNFVNSQKTFFQSTQSLSVKCRGEDLSTVEKSARTACRKRQKMDDTLTRTLLIKVYPNHLQMQLLKRQSQQAWVKPQSIKDKLRFYTDFQAGKDANEHEDEKIREARIWASENSREMEEVIRHNTNRQGLSAHYHFELEKIMIIYAQNFLKSTWNRFYVTHLHNLSIITPHLYKPTTILDNDKHAFISKKKRHNDRWPILHKRMPDRKLTYYRKINERSCLGIQDAKTAPEIHWESVGFFTREFRPIVIPPFDVSDMVNRKPRKITQKLQENALWGLSLSTTSDQQEDFRWAFLDEPWSYSDHARNNTRDIAMLNIAYY